MDDNTSPPIPTALRRALHSLGASEAAVRQTIAVARALRARARETATEHAAAIDLASGATVGYSVSGTANDVDVSSLIARIDLGGRYIFLHTHRSSAGFSDLDAAVLVAHPYIAAIAVIGDNGTLYLLSKGEAFGPIDPTVLVSLVRASVVVARRPYLPRVRAGTLDADVAKQRILHDVWRYVAPRLGLEYYRFVPRKEPQGAPMKKRIPASASASGLRSNEPEAAAAKYSVFDDRLLSGNALFELTDEQLLKRSATTTDQTIPAPIKPQAKRRAPKKSADAA